MNPSSRISQLPSIRTSANEQGASDAIPRAQLQCCLPASPREKVVSCGYTGVCHVGPHPLLVIALAVQCEGEQVEAVTLGVSARMVAEHLATGYALLSRSRAGLMLPEHPLLDPAQGQHDGACQHSTVDA